MLLLFTLEREAWYKMSPFAFCFYHWLFHPRTESMCSGSRCVVKTKPISFIIAKNCSYFHSNVKKKISSGGKTLSFPTSYSLVHSCSRDCVFLHPIHQSQRKSRLDRLKFFSISMQIRCMAELLSVKEEEFDCCKSIGERSGKAT